MYQTLLNKLITLTLSDSNTNSHILCGCLLGFCNYCCYFLGGKVRWLEPALLWLQHSAPFNGSVRCQTDVSNSSFVLSATLPKADSNLVWWILLRPTAWLMPSLLFHAWVWHMQRQATGEGNTYTHNYPCKISNNKKSISDIPYFWASSYIKCTVPAGVYLMINGSMSFDPSHNLMRIFYASETLKINYSSL